MAEKIISPGVFTKENDLSFVQQGVGAIGAAIVGPTVKGPAMIPTQVWSYSEYQAMFGDSFKSTPTNASNADYYQYLTSYTAKEYLKHGGPLTVVRILPDSEYSFATASTHYDSGSACVAASMSLSVAVANNADVFSDAPSEYSTSFYYTGSDDGQFVTTAAAPNFYIETGSTVYGSIANLVASMSAVFTNDTITTGSTNSYTIQFSASTCGTTGNQMGAFTSSLTSSAGIPEGPYAASPTNGSNASAALNTNAIGVGKSGSWWNDHTASFKIKTISDGLIMNSTLPEGSPFVANDVLIDTTNEVKYGTKDNFRWEISNVNEAKGTFTLAIRRGNDSNKRKVILETWNNCSLDPNEQNYIGQVIGTQYNTIADSTTAYPYIQSVGTYPNRSKYVYIDEASVMKTVDYLDENGNILVATYTGSLPAEGVSGSFGGGANGTNYDISTPNMNENITSNTNVQGLNVSSTTQTGYISYDAAINVLKNQDEYDINLIMMPGISYDISAGLTNNLVSMCEDRGDVMTIIDGTIHGASIATVNAKAEAFDSSYGAMYWPWVQIADTVTGKYVWVPQSVIMPSIYAFNDKVAHEWFAPAGLNRGGQETVVQAERKLTHANRDTLYDKNVNPVATFPGEGVVVWGQKTLQKKASALDRVNVRRLLINLKKFIASVSKYLIFENNTAQTRNRFLAQVNPYMESVQQRQGLYAFKVVMDETNNTPDVIDRNIMKGDIFIQPAKAAEFIVIDFNIMPTGATFND